MTVPELFDLSDPLSTSAVRAGTGNVTTYRSVCAARRAEYSGSSSLPLTVVSGRYYRDFVWVCIEPIIHSRIVEILVAAAATGWKTYPITLSGKRGEPVPGYHGLAVAGRCDSIGYDERVSRRVSEPGPYGPIEFVEGLAIDLGTWDGSDMFMARDHRSGRIIVTKKVHDAFREADVTNVLLRDVREVRSPV